MTEQVIEKSGTRFVRIATKQSTATEDKTPKDVIVERGLTVYLGGAGMNGLEILVHGLFDYAGMFPSAALSPSRRSNR